jgi:hypothetical protein
MDDMYPRDGSFYQAPEPDSQLQEKQEERARVKSAIPMLNDLISRFDERIAFYSSIDSIPADPTKSPAAFQRLVAANRLVKDTLVSEKEYLEALRDEYK